MIYIITLKENASKEELTKAKETAKSQGGTIKDDFPFINGFSVEYPDDAVSTLSSNEHINVEQDGVVTTQ